MKNSPFKVVAAIVAVLLGMALYAGVNGKLTSLPQELLGAVYVPFKSATASISDKLSVWNDRNLNIDKIIEENEKLREENHKLMQQQVAFDKMKIENEEYKKFLGIKEENPEYEISAASVIGRDGLEKFYSFTIDAGEDEGIEVNDVVMSSVGVVGIVAETGPNYSHVYTVLNPSVNVACFVSSTRDTGVVCGDSRYSTKEKTIIKYLPKNTEAKVGDIISTTGMGEVFPKDLLVGTIEEIIADTSGNYSYAVVQPVSDIANIKTVFIIKDY